MIGPRSLFVNSVSAVRPLVILAALLCPACILVPRAQSADAETYRTPPKVVADILTAPRVPRGAPNVSPDGARMVLPDLPSLVSISVLAEPVEKLAGLEILPALHCTRGQLKFALSGFSVVDIANGNKARAKLPEGARVGPIAWSTGGDRLACALYSAGGAELWIVDAKNGAARRIEGVKLNTAIVSQFEWTLDDRAIVCVASVPGAGPLPERNRIPLGPETRIGAGKATPQRTSRDVLRTRDDQDRFTALTRSRLMRVAVDGTGVRPIGADACLMSFSLAPDEKRVVIESVETPALGFPYYLFARRVEIVDLDGGKVALVGTAPLNDRSAISSLAPLGPRDPMWSRDGKALWFFSWQDTPGADAAVAIRDTTQPQPGTDRLMRLDAPFTGEPVAVTTSDFQFEEMEWTDAGSKLLLGDGYAPRRRARMWWIDPSDAAHRTVLVDRSTEGVYDDPGLPLTHRVAHQDVLWTAPDGNSLFLAGNGFRSDGQRPFLDRMDLASAKTTRLYECAPNVLEPAQALLSADAKRFVTSRQSNTLVPNYYLRSERDKGGRKLSEYVDPAPALTASKRMQFTFMRPDSVRLNAEVVLPAGWKPGTALPTICWVYPNDYRSAAAASQNRRSPNRFPSQSPLNPEVLVTQGYAVVYPDIAVVGTNDNYVEEIQISARAAIDEAVRRGFCDPKRVGVGGHSYGAFSTANLLAHTDLFRAGTASDGAYNRTLTPFTFQAEERNLWQARETYLKMSPFLYADQIKAPLLLLHNLDDTNVGTNPIQSERMYEAMNGMGKTVSLIEYPYEDHGPAARESVLDYWSRVIDWFDRYVKNADAKTAAGSPSP